MFINFTTRLLLQVYFVAIAALSLSYIHIEDNKDAFRFVAASAHKDHNAHVLLHQIISSHFGDRSDHLRASPGEELLDTESRIVLRQTDDTTPALIIPASSEIPSRSFPTFAAAISDVTPPSFGVSALSSGLSPPLV